MTLGSTEQCDNCLLPVQAVEAEYELVEDSSPLDSLPSSPLVLEDSPPSSPLAEESFEMVTGRGEEGGLGPQDTSLLGGLPPTPHNSSVDLTREEVTPLANLKSGVEALISELSTGQEGEASTEVEKEAKGEAVKEVVEAEEKVEDVAEKVEEVEAIGTIREEVEESEQR